MIKLKELIPNKAFKKLYEYIDLYSHRRNVDEYLESFKKELDSKRGGSYEMDSVEYETDRWENDSKILKNRNKALETWSENLRKALKKSSNEFEKLWKK